MRVPASELALYQSVAHIGNPKQQKKSNSLAKRPDLDIEKAEKLNSIKGAKRRKTEKWPEPPPASSSSESSDSEEENNEEKPEEKPPSPEPEPKVPPPEEPKNKPEIPKKPRDPKLDFLPVTRSEEIQDGRLALPILSEEGPILEAISENDVILICGETGSGKTTQIPQFLYEAGYTSRGMIGMTEPRRIAAISAAERIRYEMVMKEPVIGESWKNDISRIR